MEDSSDAQNPSGGASGRRSSMQPALGSDLMVRIVDPKNVARAWKQVHRNQGAAGVDGISIAEFADHTRLHWAEIRRSLLEGTYRPAPVLRKEIPKRSGGQRLLGIPTVLDRVIQQAIVQVLTPIFDPHFSESSFGYRPKRSAHGAVVQVQRALRSGFRVCVSLDLDRFFDRVPHDRLMARVSERVSDPVLLALIGRYLRAGVWVEGKRVPTTEGVPQGGPLSPLLSNILLDRLDQELERRGHRFARYADDVLTLVRTQRSGGRVLSSLTRWLRQHLGLEVNTEKSQVAGTHKVDFLGFRFWGAKICWSQSTVQRFKAEVRRLTNRNWGVSMQHRLGELARYLRGWMGYFGLSSHYRPVPNLQTWIRRRIRMAYWVMWRWRPTRVRRMIALGVPRHWAIRTGFGSKGPWHMSRSYALNVALSDAHLQQQGLVSFRDLWIQSAPLRRTA